MKTMRCLVIDEAAKERINQTKKYAEANFLSLGQILEMIEGPKKFCVGDNPNFTCELFDGFRIVYSIMEYPNKHTKESEGYHRHISISVSGSGLPNVEAVKMIMKEFGFKNEFEKCVVFLENDKAVNVVEKID